MNSVTPGVSIESRRVMSKLPGLTMFAMLKTGPSSALPDASWSSRCLVTICMVLAMIRPCGLARTGPPLTPWATIAASVIGNSFAMSSGENAATPNAATAVSTSATT